MRLIETFESPSVVLLMEHPGHSNQKVHGRRFGAIAAQTVEQGGFSANWVGHKPKSGYMVGGVVKAVHIKTPLGLSVNAKGGISPSTRATLAADIKAFTQANRGVLRKSGMYLGTWTDDDGSVWVDVSQRMATRSAALTHGSARGEIAIYDVRGGKSIDVPEAYPTRGIPDQYDLGAQSRSATPLPPGG